jgi:hypothetical protein
MTGQAATARIKVALSACLTALALCCCLVRADGLPSYHYVRHWPEPYAQEARAEVDAALQVQAQNGLVLDQTIWNHYFAAGDYKLRRSGQAVLDRLARRQNEPVLDLYLQTARDVFKPEHPEQYGVERAALDTKRLKAITDYLAFTRPDVAIALHVHDPNPVGMSALEVVKSVRELQLAPRGILPPELQVRLSAAAKGENIPSAGLNPVAATPGTGSNPGAFGTSE